MIDDPLSQADETLTSYVFKTGRKVAREAFIDEAYGNDGVLPTEQILILEQIRQQKKDGALLLMGMVISLAEEAARILQSHNSTLIRCKALEERAKLADRSVRNLIAQNLLIQSAEPDVSP